MTTNQKTNEENGWTTVTYKKKKKKKKKNPKKEGKKIPKKEVPSVKEPKPVVFATYHNSQRYVSNPKYSFSQDDSEYKSKRKVLSAKFKKTLMNARLQKKMTQKDLAKCVNVRLQVIIDYEQRKTIIPNYDLIHKIQNVLGCKLPKLYSILDT